MGVTPDRGVTSLRKAVPSCARAKTSSPGLQWSVTMVGLAAVSGRADETVAQARAAGRPGGADLAADRAVDHRPADDPAAATQIHPAAHWRRLFRRHRQRPLPMAEQPVRGEPRHPGRSVERPILPAEDRRDLSILYAIRRLCDRGFGCPVDLGGPGHLRLRRRPGQWQFVGVVPGGLRQDRADRQLLDRGRQIAEPDRRRVHVFHREHQYRARPVVEPGTGDQQGRPGQSHARPGRPVAVGQ